LRCTYCGAEFEVPSEVKIATCPYCGTTVNIETGEVDIDHYIFPVVYDNGRAYGKLKAIISRQFGAPSDLLESMNLIDRQLHYIPLYIYYVEGRAETKEGEALEVETLAIPAMKIVPLPIPEKYKFPVRGREYFKPSIIKAGKYYTPQVVPSELEEYVKIKVYTRLISEVKLAKLDVPVEVKCRYEGLVHYPIWDFTYKYRRENYRGIVDAVCGEVLYAEYPMSTIHRTISIAIAAGLIGCGGAIGLLFGLIMKNIVACLLGGTIAGIAGAIPAATKSTYKKQVYKPRVYSKIFGESEDLRKLLKIKLPAIELIPEMEL